MSVAILGIRHHGPGSARSVQDALTQLQPDAILIEGPPEADAILHLAAHTDMQPPVALLIYLPEQPRQAAYYPFAEFSPEWQAILYGLQHNIPVRFMDLPQAYQMARQWEAAPAEDTAEATEPSATASIPHDPLQWIAEAAGYHDSERWWEDMVEQRRDNRDVFQAVLELMTAVRDAYEQATDTLRDVMGPWREAYMRQTIRATQKDGFGKIAVVCGAWHAPALHTMPAAKEDAALLRNLPKVKPTATWVPWTYGRLTFHSGYGAGVASPGYYHHLWQTPQHATLHWMSRVAALLREHDLEASSASVIEAIRLADTLAAVRERPVAGLPELNDAVLAVFCFGNDAPLRLIQQQLIVGERLGSVPDETPTMPLQQDLQREQKRLRLPPAAVRKTVELDLRKPTDLERSYLLHRLQLLNIAWGTPERTSGKGTFKEAWRLQWQPELEIALIEANVWGSTIAMAATQYAQDMARQADALAMLTALVQNVLLANLPDAVEQCMLRLQALAAVTSDIPHMMEALPALADVLRYGNVRKTDTDMLQQVVDGLVTRIAIGLPNACAALNDEAAHQMFPRLSDTNAAIVLLQEAEHLRLWREVLQKMLQQHGLHGLLVGRCARLLFDQNVLSAAATAQHMHVALSTANEPAQAAAWIEGFLHGSGLVLLHNTLLWDIVDGWVAALHEDVFVQLLPLLRRTFATFTAPERRQMGERARQPATVQPGHGDTTTDAFHTARADKVLPLVAQLLGLQHV